MLSTPKWSQRPECSEVLAEYNEWSIDRNILANDPRFESTLSRLQSNDNSFFHQFLSYSLQQNPIEITSKQMYKDYLGQLFPYLLIVIIYYMIIELSCIFFNMF